MNVPPPKQPMQDAVPATPPAADGADEKDADQREIARYAHTLVLCQPRVPAVNLLILLNCSVFLVFAVATGGWVEPDRESLIGWGSNYGLLSLDGQWWRLLSATFLHSGIAHLLVNMLTLWAYGSTCERMFGTRLFMVIYLAGGIAASIASLIWNPLVHSVGASGAIFALIGASLAYMIDNDNEVPFSVLKDHLYTLLGFVAYTVLDVMKDAFVDHAAHAGGLLAGLVFGALMSSVAQDRSPAHHRRLAFSAVGMLMALGLLYGISGQRLGHEADMSFRGNLNAFERAERDQQSRLEKLRAAPQSPVRTAELRQLAEQYRWHHERFRDLDLPASSPWKPLADRIAAYAQARQFAIQALYEPGRPGTTDWESMAAATFTRIAQSEAWREVVEYNQPGRVPEARP